MKVTDHINQAQDTLVSFEILPPLKGKGIHTLYQHLDPLMEYKPAYINVTYHRSEHVFKKNADGSFQKVIVRKSLCLRPPRLPVELVQLLDVAPLH